MTARPVSRASAELSADRLRVLHAVATAANEAATLDQLAPMVLETVCGGLGWPSGALLRWAGCRLEPVVVHGPLDTRLAPASRPTEVSADAHGVAVPLVVHGAGDLAWWFQVDGSGLQAEEHEVLHLVGIETSRVVERETTARLLRESEERLHSVFALSPLPMGLTLGETGTYAVVNQALCDLLGRPAEELIGMSARDLVHADDIPLTDPAGAAALAAPDGRHQVELRMVRPDGEVRNCLITLAWIGGPDGSRNLLAHMEDITARRAAEEMLRRQAELDSLTGLANRAHLGASLAALGQAGTQCVVVFVDLDGFKLINDTRGHDVGDEVLVEVARRLRHVVAPHDIVARFGGDEFVVVCPQPAEGDRVLAEIVARRIEQALGEPVETQNGPASVTASLGIATGQVDPAAPQQLVHRADAAMNQAKQLGRNRSETYGWHLHQRTLEYRRTEAALRNALDDHRFVVHYQPIVAIADGSVVGFEALVRLVDEEGSLVPPGTFISVAEQSGLVVPMGAWVLEESCRTLARLRRHTGRPLTVSVNVAARQAARSDLGATVRRALEDAGLPEEALTLELTESALLEADESTLRQLVDLRERGIAIGLDDFGTGYSSLTYLRRLPVSHLKVDRSFVEGMVVSTSDRAIVRAVTRLADDLGLGWVAEGIETVEQRAAVAAMGRGHAQGFLFGRPTPAAMLPALLSSQRELHIPA